MAENEFGCVLCHGMLSLYIERVFDTRFGVDGHWDIYRCESCNLFQLSPLPSNDMLARLYENYYNFGGSKDGLYTDLRSAFLDSPIYLLWMAIDGDISFHSRVGQGRLLDVGCNEGRGLQIYKNNGFEAEGLELNERAAAEARKHGFSVSTDSLEDFRPERPYDVVVLSNVLEHSLQPQKMLLHIASIIKQGGYLWVSCPNADSWQRGLFGQYWINWHVPFHIMCFSQRTLCTLLEKSGFKIEEIRQESPALWFANSLIARLFAKPGVPTKQLRSPTLVASLILLIRVFLFPILWFGNRCGRGDCLIGIAKKM